MIADSHVFILDWTRFLFKFCFIFVSLFYFPSTKTAMPPAVAKITISPVTIKKTFKPFMTITPFYQYPLIPLDLL
ncbi:MAG: hypothetical protein A3D10_00040 [Omnitrophica WOR_2 bacterium RIFCSPHIGHO2_02_FULL_48_11]|nr:MAG: hypothetical protein A3D10_00040 [Omnitrophica WOR_2 bacterium RIFCSPHIGHO2_02_FULL_48_11]